MQPSLEVANGKCILLVDDEPTVLESLRQTLAREGHAIVTAANGVEALALLNRYSFSTIISDQRMPMLSGLELLAQAKEVQPDATRVLVTAVLDLTLVLEAINRGEVYRFIVKPWLREELLVTVQNAIQRHDQALANRRLNAALESANARLVETEARLAIQQSAAARQDEQIGALTAAREEIFDCTVHSLLRMLEVYHPVTVARARRGHQLCSTLATKLGLPPLQRRDMAAGALLQDIGLVGVPRKAIELWNGSDSALLDQDTKILIEQHPLVGQQLLSFRPEFAGVGRLIREHHENFDGTGFPDGLKGDQIAWLARLLSAGLAIANGGRDLESNWLALKAAGDSRFDPEALQAFACCVTGGSNSRTSRAMSLEELRPGMVIASGIYSSNGKLLVAEGEALTRAHLERISEREPMNPLLKSVSVYC